MSSSVIASWESTATQCGRCQCPFNFIVRQHHCRRCGRIYCGDCSKYNLLIPLGEFATPPHSHAASQIDPSQLQRVCEPCAQTLFMVQDTLRLTASRSRQEPNPIDATSFERYRNTPLNFSMDREIQKAVFTLANIDQAIGSAEETESPRDALAGAVGVVFLTVATAGIVFSGRLGSGLVLGRARSGRWSAPSAIMLVGFGGGLQLGVEVADIVIVIDSRDALDALCDSAQLAVATKATATAGSAGRMANRSGLTNKRGPSDQPVSRMRVYSQSRGLFAGVALDTGLLISRPDLNAQFYGSELPVQELLLGRYPAPKGARELYEALDAATASASTSRQSHAASEGIDNDEPNPFAATADDTHGMPSTNASADLPSSSSFGVDNDEQELSV